MCFTFLSNHSFNKLCSWHCLPGLAALQPPAQFLGNGRIAEEAEAVSALSCALYRQGHHGAAQVHVLPAHLQKTLGPKSQWTGRPENLGPQHHTHLNLVLLPTQ